MSNILKSIPPFLWHIFIKLKDTYHFPLNVDDLNALFDAIHQGFGLSSKEDLMRLCSLLWAKSIPEQQIITSLFVEQEEIPSWQLAWLEVLKQAIVPGAKEKNIPPLERALENNNGKEITKPDLALEIPKSKEEDIKNKGMDIKKFQLPKPMPFNEECIPKINFDLTPHYPLERREIVQFFRGFYRPVREGPLMELDIDLTIKYYCKIGFFSNVVLTPSKKNKAQLVILVDREGSMGPFHGFINEICEAITAFGKFRSIAIYFFHDTPVMSANKRVLTRFANTFKPSFDPIIDKIEPFDKDTVFLDTGFYNSIPIQSILKSISPQTGIIIISDAGAARNKYDLYRILNAIAFGKAMRLHSLNFVWLNPLPRNYWRNNTASQISRYIPMYPLDKNGISEAINVLKGKQPFIERPI